MKKNPTTIFIQLLRAKTIKNKLKNNIVKKTWEKKSYLNVVTSEAKKTKE